MNILLLEDDHLQADWIRSEFEREFRAAVRVVRTELEFRDLVPELAESPPDVAVLDVIVRWTDPAPDMRKRSEDTNAGPSRAGVRCARLLSQRCPKVPIILYTVLERSDLEDDLAGVSAKLIVLSKESRPKPLLDFIRSLTKRD